MNKKKYTLKELQKEVKQNNVIDTGFFIYIGFKEKWTQCILDGIKYDEFVSSLGRVYSPQKMRLVALTPTTGGYLYAILHHNGKSCKKRMNRVVLESFNGPPPKNMEIPEADHIVPNQ